MPIDLSKISFWKSVLIVVISTTVLFVGISFLTFQLMSKFLTPFQGFQSGPVITSGFFFLTDIILVLFYILYFVLLWWIGVVITDYSATRFFRLESNYSALIPAFAIIYSIMSFVSLIIFIFLEMLLTNILLLLIIMIFGLFLVISAIKDIYEISWKKAFLVWLVVGIITLGVSMLGYLIGIGIGFGVGLML